LDIFTRWKEGRIRSLTPTQLSNIRKKMMGRRGEVQNSMWADLKSELSAKFPIVR
jgi:hypothetical protein